MTLPRCIALWVSPLAVTASLVALCPPAFAGIFGKDKAPIPQWALDAAKTKTPDYVKDASTVVLYDERLETVDARGRATERERKAIRILKPQGRGAPCGVSYDVDEKINYFRAWTIAADERQYQAQETDFTEFGDTSVPVMLSTRKLRVVHPPAADVGAMVFCESEELLAPYSQETIWSVQSDQPVVFQALEVDLPASLSQMYSWHRHDDVKPIEVAPGHWRWELKDTPALTLRDIPSVPPAGGLFARMSVHWGDTATGKEQQWRAFGQWMEQLEADRTEPSPEIKAAVAQLTAGAPDFYTKLSRITESIQKNIRYFIVMRGIGGLQANHAADIYRNRYGDCKDKTTLLISMLQVAGVRAYYMPTDSRRGVVDPDSPSLVGDHMITAIEIPDDVHDARLQAVVTAKSGKRYLIFDPTDERTPVGNLRPELQGGYGLLCAGAASQVMALPVLAPDANGTERKGSFVLTADGALSGKVDTFHSGPEGAEYRLFLKDADERERRVAMETNIARDLPGVELTSLDVVQTPEFDKPLEFHLQVSAAQYAHHAGNLLLVRPRVVGTLTEPFDDKARSLPIDLGATGRWHDSFDIALPKGFVVDEIPDPVSLDLDFASYRSSVVAAGDKLHYEREYIVKQVQIPAEKAADFRKLEGAILNDERATAVLKQAKN